MKIALENSLAPLLLYVSSVNGISPAIEGSGNTSLPSIPSNLTVSSSPLPPAPPGFEPQLHWDTSVPLYPNAVYVAAIKLMYGLSQQRWFSTVDLDHDGLRTVEPPDYNAVIYTSDSPPSTELTTGLAVRALYDVVQNMAAQEPGFYKVTSNIKLQRQFIGRIRITNKQPSPSSVSSDHSASSNTPSMVDSLVDRRTSFVNASLVTYSGEIPEAEDERFKISYEYVGNNIRSQEMFSAMLAGLADVAQYENDGPCPWITAISSSGKVVFHIDARPRQALIGWQISRTFYLLVFHLFLVQRTVKEMRFSLFYYGTSIAGGYMKNMEPVGGDSSMGLTANE